MHENRVCAVGRPLHRLQGQSFFLNDARESAASLAQAFRWALTPIPRSILDSRSPAEVQKYILALYADWSPDRVQPLIEDALVAQQNAC